MKTTIARALATLCLGLGASGAATAGGIYDGIYQIVGTDIFYSVHQSGNTVIVGNFQTAPIPIEFILADGKQRFSANRLDYWNLFSGALTGSFASLKGEWVMGACNFTGSANFDPSNLTLTVSSSTPTAVGQAQGIDCAGLVKSSLGTFRLVKAF